ncbi:MAG TPA: sigma-70 family RNA polymerase sigma factor [Thermoanaerobaculia bacterium]|nr:sigma-70 family RNA polymerase sigma factor [Thermoanaerobaculia bacterium]
MPSHSDDLALARRMLAGDERAFEAFAERFARALYRFAQARLGGDREATLEVVQTAMCKALAKLDSYRGEASLFTWLCACCRNEMLMRFRSRRTAPAEVELTDDVEPAIDFGPWGGRGPEVALLEREAARRVHLALDLLPAHYARALEWKYLEDLPVQEIAARLNLGPKAAESLLTRARSAFRAGYESLRSRREGLAGGLDERVLNDG